MSVPKMLIFPGYGAPDRSFWPDVRRDIRPKTSSLGWIFVPDFWRFPPVFFCHVFFNLRPNLGGANCGLVGPCFAIIWAVLGLWCLHREGCKTQQQGGPSIDDALPGRPGKAHLRIHASNLATIAASNRLPGQREMWHWRSATKHAMARCMTLHTRSLHYCTGDPLRRSQSHGHWPYCSLLCRQEPCTAGWQEMDTDFLFQVYCAARDLHDRCPQHDVG